MRNRKMDFSSVLAIQSGSTELSNIGGAGDHDTRGKRQSLFSL